MTVGVQTCRSGGNPGITYGEFPQAFEVSSKFLELLDFSIELTREGSDVC